MKITDAQLKRALLDLIGQSIDEASISPHDDADHNSFVEMEQQVIHYAGDCGDRYFRVDLKETVASEYFEMPKDEDL